MKVYFQTFGDSFFLSLDGLRQPTGWTQSILRDLDGLRQPTGWTQSILRDLDGLRQLVIYFPTLM